MGKLDTGVVLEDLVVEEQLLDLVAEEAVHVHVPILLILVLGMTVHLQQVDHTFLRFVSLLNQTFYLSHLVVELRVVHVGRVQIDERDVYLLFLDLFRRRFVKLGAHTSDSQNVRLGHLSAWIDLSYMLVFLQFAFLSQTEVNALLEQQPMLVVESLGSSDSFDLFFQASHLQDINHAWPLLRLYLQNGSQ